MAESRSTLGILRSRGFEDFRKDGYYLYALASLSEVAVTSECLESANLLYSLLEPYRSLSIVAGWGTVLDGSVSHYLGLLARLTGDFPLSRQHFDKALQANVALNAPLLLARTQLEYARLWASQPTSESSQHVSELASAAAFTFFELGLEAYRIQAERLAEALPPIRSTPSSVAEQRHTSCERVNSLTRNGDLWILEFDASTAHIRHRLGLHYIAIILGARGEPVHVLDLLDSLGIAPPERMSDCSDTVDHIARREYKARLTSLELEIQLATENNDLGHLQRLQHERSSLIQELSRSYGISGHRRPSRSPAERARISVKNRITAALQAIRPYHPAAFQHLRRSLITGTYCRYSPSNPTEWRL